MTIRFYWDEGEQFVNRLAYVNQLGFIIEVTYFSLLSLLFIRKPHIISQYQASSDLTSHQQPMDQEDDICCQNHCISLQTHVRLPRPPFVENSKSLLIWNMPVQTLSLRNHLYQPVTSTAIDLFIIFLSYLKY